MTKTGHEVFQALTAGLLIHLYIIVSEHFYFVKEKDKISILFSFFLIESDIRGMDEMTIKEISEVLSISPGAAKIRLQRKGIKPIKMIGQTGIYDPSVVEAIRNVPGRGRPPKAKSSKPPEKE
jgi:hypothetical protein